MDGSSSEIVYPSIEQICDVNRQLVNRYGGTFVPPDNLLNPNSLNYILAAISNTLFGVDQYPTIKEKAAALTYQIITRHVFTDGNKRTAVFVGWEFLSCNGHPITLDMTINDLAVAIAEASANQSELLQWFHDHQED